MLNYVIFSGNRTAPIPARLCSLLMLQGFKVQPLLTPRGIAGSCGLVFYSGDYSLFSSVAPLAAAASVPVWVISFNKPAEIAGFSWQPSFFLNTPAWYLSKNPALF